MAVTIALWTESAITSASPMQDAREQACGGRHISADLGVERPHEVGLVQGHQREQVYSAVPILPHAAHPP